MNQVDLYQQRPRGFDQRQTGAEANYHQAMAHASADPRFTAKKFDRAGVSRGAGQYSYGAAQGAQDYSQHMAQAEAARMNDAYANANWNLAEQDRQQQFGSALAGLHEQNQQAAYMHQLGQQGRAMDFMGNAFNQMASPGSMASPIGAFQNFGPLGGLGR